jgi:hypothetical protein
MRIDQIQWNQAPIPATAQQIEAVETAVGMQFPEDLRDFLQRYQGAYPDDPCLRLVQGGRKRCVGIGQFVGVIPGGEAYLPTVISWFAGRLPANQLPFALEAGGSLFCVDTSRKTAGVTYWDSELEGMAGASTLVARTFSEFIEQLEPYDERAINAWIASAS